MRVWDVGGAKDFDPWGNTYDLLMAGKCGGVDSAFVVTTEEGWPGCCGVSFFYREIEPHERMRIYVHADTYPILGRNQWLSEGWY
jgi:hypothetical protein